MGNVSLVIVSHSRKLAEGLVQIAAQMAGSTVHIVAAAGLEEELGTSATAIVNELQECPEDSPILLFFDLGSAYMNCQMALELAPPSVRHRAAIVDAPLVEGIISAAVAASMGQSQADVIAAAQEAYQIRKVSD